MTTTTRKVLAAAALLASPALLLVIYAVGYDHLPSRLPDPWDWSGWSDGDTATKRAFLGGLVPAAVFTLGALGALLFGNGGKRNLNWVYGLSFGSALSTWLHIKTLVVSLGADYVSDVHQYLWQFLVASICAAASVAVVIRIMPVPVDPPTDAPLGSRFSFEPGVRVVWSGHEVSERQLLQLGIALVAAVVLAFWSVALTIAALVIAITGLRVLYAKVLITDKGIRIAGSPWGWPHHDVDLDDVTRASTAECESVVSQTAVRLSDLAPLDPHSRCISKETVLVLELRGRRPLAVSLDEPYEAADVVNALLLRARATSGADELAEH